MTSNKKLSAVAMLLDEGLANVFARHDRHAEATRRAVRAWGLELQCEDPQGYAPGVTAIRVPEGHSADKLRDGPAQISRESAKRRVVVGALGLSASLALLGAVGEAPAATLPLRIFEPRYRQMLKAVLASNRLFAVTGLDQSLLSQPGQFEPPHRVASVGIVRACQKNENGTSNLLLQGLCRVEVLSITREEPYRRIRVRAS